MNKYKYKAKSITDLRPIAKELLSSLGSKSLVAFKGRMGSGKTTFIKTICEELEIEDVVNSPTFSIINQYSSVNGEVVYHFDYYRLEKEQEALDIGLYDYLDSGNLCLMEWPEKVEKLLPKECVYLEIKEDILSGEREISWEV
jgi:tRNA threonylcarbamoyladenosine biosynthesis protein TsaE